MDIFLEAVCSIIAANEWKELGYQQEKYYKSVLMSNVKSELAILSIRTVAKLMSDRFANISSNLKEGKDSMKHAIEEYHRENRQRAEMIREQNSINPNRATFLKFNRLLNVPSPRSHPPPSPSQSSSPSTGETKQGSEPGSATSS